MLNKNSPSILEKPCSEKKAFNGVFTLFIVILFSQMLLNGMIHQSISTGAFYSKSIELLLEDDDKKACYLYDICDYNPLRRLNDSLGLGHSLFLPNITKEEGSRIAREQDHPPRKHKRFHKQAGNRRYMTSRQLKSNQFSVKNLENHESVGYALDSAFPIKPGRAMQNHVGKSSLIWESRPITEPRRTMLRDQLIVGVTFYSFSNKSVELQQSRFHKSINQYALNVFEAALKLLPYKLSYEKFLYTGSYDDLLKDVALKKMDAVVGDIVISSEGYELVQFSQPYTEAGLVMLVTCTTNNSQIWLFISIFTPWMWFLLVATSFFTGFVLWLVEYQRSTDSGDLSTMNEADGSSLGRVAIVFSLVFATLYYGQREGTKSCLSHFVLAPWLLLMLVVSATFTSSFTSMTTNSQIEPLKTDIEMLKRTNAAIGYDGNSFTFHYLVNVLGFKAKNIRSIAPIDDYEKLLSGRIVEVAFVLMPYAKVFLAKHCTGFAIAGPAYDLGGFGFVFPRDSSLALDISQAILRLKERGDLQVMEEEMLSSYKSSTSASGTNARQSLGAGPFTGFFIISGCASTMALLMTVFRLSKQSLYRRLSNIRAALIGRGIWILLAALFAQSQTANERQLPRISSTPEPEG